MDPNQKRIVTPEQLAGTRLDEVSKLLHHVWNTVLPQMEMNFVQALSTGFLQTSALMIALKAKGVLTDEDMLKAFEVAKTEMEAKQRAAHAEAAKQAEEAKAAQGPKIVDPKDLEKLQGNAGDSDTKNPNPQGSDPQKAE